MRDAEVAKLKREAVGVQYQIDLDTLLARMEQMGMPMKVEEQVGLQNGVDCGFLGLQKLLPGSWTVKELRMMTAAAHLGETSLRHHFFELQRSAKPLNKEIKKKTPALKRRLGEQYLKKKVLENTGLALLVKRLNEEHGPTKVLACNEQRNYTLYDDQLSTHPGHAVKTETELFDLLVSKTVQGILYNRGNFHWVAVVFRQLGEPPSSLLRRSSRLR